MNGRSVGAQRRSLTGDCGETVRYYRHL